MSLEQQAAAISAYAAAHGFAVAATLAHNGVSGGKRARFDELWDVVQLHHAQAVIAYHFDRLGRDLEHLLAFRHRCDRAGIEIHLVGQGKLAPARSSQGFLETSIHGMLAEHYRLLVAEKTRDALGRLRATGCRWWGGANGGRRPYGWIDEGGRVAQDPAEQGMLEALRRLEAEQPGLSLRALARQLAHAGYLARSGRPLAPSTLRILRQRATVASGL